MGFVIKGLPCSRLGQIKVFKHYLEQIKIHKDRSFAENRQID